jgi:hypothetical protein
MTTHAFENYYIRKKVPLLRQFRRAARHAQVPLIRRYGSDFADAVTVETRREYEALIPELPYIGGKANPLTTNLIEAAWFLALYRVMKARGKSIAAIGKLIEEMVDTWLRAYPSFLLRLVGRLRFTRWYINRLTRQAEISQQRRYSEDWVYTAFRGDGKEFDFGMDYTECGIVKFYKAHSATELIPYMCDTPTPKGGGLLAYASYLPGVRRN